jgi:hypothetical protein
MLTVSSLAPACYTTQSNSASLWFDQQNPGAALPSYSKRVLSFSK